MTHVYLMPGMAANPSIFDFIELPKDAYTIHYLEWLLPEGKESIEMYAKRISETINNEDIVLLGVSFGGVIVQEMARFLKVKKLIIVSSVKSREELPRRMKLSRKLKLHELLPMGLVENVESFAKYAVGKSLKERLALYKKYLSVSDKHYMEWAVREMVCWDQREVPKGIIHIHGDGDKVFPAKYINDAIIIPGGTHIMIMTKARWFNKNLPILIEE